MIRSISKSLKHSLRSIQSGLSSILFAVPISLWGEKLKACGSILDAVSYGDRGPLRSLCPYGVRCIGRFLFI